MYVCRITFNLASCKRKDRLTWHCRCPCFFNFFYNYLENAFLKEKTVSIRMTSFVCLYVCWPSLYVCMMKTTSLIPYSEVRNRDREREREGIEYVLFLSLFVKYWMRRIDETEIETYWTSKRILLLSIVQLDQVRLLHFNYHSIRFSFFVWQCSLMIYSWKSLSHHSGNHFPFFFFFFYLNESVLLKETDDLTKANKTLSSSS